MEEGKGPTSQLYYTLRGKEKTQVHARTFPGAGSPTARVDRDSWMPNGISGGRDWISRQPVPHRAKCPNWICSAGRVRGPD